MLYWLPVARYHSATGTRISTDRAQQRWESFFSKMTQRSALRPGAQHIVIFIKKVADAKFSDLSADDALSPIAIFDVIIHKMQCCCF